MTKAKKYKSIAPAKVRLATDGELVRHIQKHTLSMADSQLDAFSAGADRFLAIAYEMYGLVEPMAIGPTGVMDGVSREVTTW